LVTFFAEAKKVTRSAAGRVEALLLIGTVGTEQDQNGFQLTLE
jgi:hypothetical protein